MPIPKLDRVDHLHIHVVNREDALSWYTKVLGFHVLEDLAHWAQDNGPLTLGHSNSDVHIALFNDSAGGQGKTIAFGVDGMAFLQWYAYLPEQGVKIHLEDHEPSWSMYFKDPDGNRFEITSFDYDIISERLR